MECLALEPLHVNYLLLTVVVSREHFCGIWIYNYTVSLRIKAFLMAWREHFFGFETYKRCMRNLTYHVVSGSGEGIWNE